jgi:hypothetical protein
MVFFTKNGQCVTNLKALCPNNGGSIQTSIDKWLEMRGWGNAYVFSII